MRHCPSHDWDRYAAEEEAAYTAEDEAKSAPPQWMAGDVDDATWVGNDFDGVYILAKQDGNGDWWGLTMVDSDSGGFCQQLREPIGPVDSEAAAMDHARTAAEEWCIDNDVVW